jgi:hypothetical protein
MGRPEVAAFIFRGARTGRRSKRCIGPPDLSHLVIWGLNGPFWRYGVFAHGGPTARAAQGLKEGVHPRRLSPRTPPGAIGCDFYYITNLDLPNSRNVA